MSDLSQLAPQSGPFAGIRPPDTPIAPAGLPPGVPRGGAMPRVAEPQRAVTEEPKKKKKKPVKLVALVVIVLIGGYVAKGKLMKPHYGPTDPPPPGQIFDLGTVTTNLADGHLAQVGVSLQLTAVASQKELTKDTSELLGSTVQALGKGTYASLLPPSGRAALQAQLLHAYQSDLGTAAGGQVVSAVYFTSFVLQ